MPCRGLAKRAVGIVRVFSLRRLVQLALLPALLGIAAEQLGGVVVLSLQDLVSTLLWGRNDTPILAASPVLEAQDLPLRTSGRWLVNKKRQRVRLRCVNWYGAHLPTMVVGGLDKQPLARLALVIRTLGFNCVRLPYSLELQLHPSRPSPAVLAANPELLNASGLEILDRTVAALTSARLLVVLNNHQGPAMWCCSEDDGEGLWYTSAYPEKAWLDSLGSLAVRYRADPFVIGYDLRNEPRGVPTGTWAHYKRPDWGSGRNDTDWAAAALRGARAVTSGDPDALLFVEGLYFAMHLSGLRSGGRLHKEPELFGRVVYEVHEYCWYHLELYVAGGLTWLCFGWALSLTWDAWRGSRLKDHPSSDIKRHRLVLVVAMIVGWSLRSWLVSYWHYAAVISSRWGFLLEEGEAPVWVGEIGTNGPWVTAEWWMEVGEASWWRNLIRYLREHEVDYAYWAFNGDKAGEDETFGLLQPDYATLRHPWIIEMLP